MAPSIAPIRSELEPILALAIGMHDEGADEAALRARLASMGLRERGIGEVLDALGARNACVRRRRGWRNLALGGLFLVGGAVAVVLTLDTAGATGVVSMAAYGAVGAGVGQAVLGARQLSTS